MSQPNLNEDLNIVANSNLEITLLDGDLNIIQALDDEPNDVGGLTSAELKAKFDEAGNTIKTYINGTLIPEILTEEATEAARAAAEAQREVNENQRIENENARIAAEQARVDETNGVVAQANNAAQSWAVGGTGTREGEDTNNAKYWSEQAAAAAGGGVTSFKGRTGSVIPASGDYTAEMVGAYSKGETDTLLQKKATILKDAFGLYVSTSGNDTTGDGSQSNPFRTIQHAVDMIPPVLNGKVVSINVAAGTYDEDVVISGKCASRGERPIYINGASSKDDAVNYKVRSITASGTGMGSIQIRGFKFLGYAGEWDIGSYGDACFYIENCILDSATKYGVYLADRPYSHACIVNSTISNKTKTAFLVELGNILLARECTGSDNAVVFTSGGDSGFGGIIFNCGSNTISGTVAESKSYGGQIFK